MAAALEKLQSTNENEKKLFRTGQEVVSVGVSGLKKGADSITTDCVGLTSSVASFFSEFLDKTQIAFEKAATEKRDDDQQDSNAKHGSFLQKLSESESDHAWT